MFESDTNLICFREARSRREGPLRRLVGWLLYPSLLVVPYLFFVTTHGSSEDARWGSLLLALLGHLMYLVVRTLGAAAASIAREREARTLETLMSTRLTPRELALGVVKASAGPRLREMVLWSPLLAAILAQELNALQIVLLLGVSAVTVVFMACLGLSISVSSANTAVAARRAMAWIGMLAFGSFIVDLLLFRDVAISLLVNPLVTGAGIISLSISGWWACPVVYAILSAVLFFTAVESLQSSQEPVTRAPRRSGQGWLPSGNPVYALERKRCGGRPLWIYPAMLLGLAAFFKSFGGMLSDVFGYILFFHLLYFCLAACGVAAPLFARERETGTWESLLASRLTPGEIVRGKLAAGLGPLLRELFVFSPLLILLARPADVPVERAVGLVLLTAAVIVGIGLFTAWTSLVTGSTSTALHRGVSLVSLLGLVTLLLDAALAMGGYDDHLPLFSSVSPLMGGIAAAWPSSFSFGLPQLVCPVAFLTVALVSLVMIRREMVRR